MSIVLPPHDRRRAARRGPASADAIDPEAEFLPEASFAQPTGEDDAASHEDDASAFLSEWPLVERVKPSDRRPAGSSTPIGAAPSAVEPTRTPLAMSTAHSDAGAGRSYAVRARQARWRNLALVASGLAAGILIARYVPARDDPASVAETRAPISLADVPRASPPASGASAPAAGVAETPPIDPRTAKPTRHAPQRPEPDVATRSLAHPAAEIEDAPPVVAPASLAATAVTALQPLAAAPPTPQAAVESARPLAPATAVTDAAPGRADSPGVAVAAPRALLEGREAELVAVRRVLHTYEDSYDRLDAQAVAAIWRGLDAGALQRAFQTLSHQNLTFDRCDVSLADVRATASCRGQLRYVPRIGAREARSQSMTWTIELSRVDDRWLIERVSAR
jgi:hypothetical protein